MTTAEFMKQIRRTLCLNQTEFAKALSVTVSSISYYEKGKRLPSYATIRKLIALAKKNRIKVSLDDIRPDEGEVNESTADSAY